MAIDLKKDFLGGLDLDSSPYYMEANSYADALNISRDAIEGANDVAITNIVGNRLVSYNKPTGLNVTIGSFPFPLRNTVIYFNWNINLRHQVLEYDNDTRTITKIFENLTDSSDVDILGFTQYNKITSINIFPRTTDDGDLLFFIDSVGRPTVMNITRFKNGEYTPVTRDIIDVNKRPPLSPPSCVYDNDVTHSLNYLRNRLFRFQQLWNYDDFEESTPSPVSAVPLPTNILDQVFSSVSTNNNVITIQLNSGPKNVKGVTLLMSYSEKTNSWNDFENVITLDKETLGIADDTDFAYQFYNEGTYPVYDLIKRRQLFSYVPDKAKSQEMPNGNVLTYGAITEGLSRELTPNVVIAINTVAAGSGGATGSLNGVATYLGTMGSVASYKIDFTGVPTVGTVVELNLITTPGGVVKIASTYTTIFGDTAASVTAGLVAGQTMPFIIQNVSAVGGTLFFGFIDANYDFDSLVISSPSVLVDTSSIATWGFQTQRILGLAYFDEKGKTNGVLYNTGIEFPAYAENGSQQVLLPYINAKIYHVPPEWAYSFQWVVSPEGTTWLYWECIDVVTTETDFIYFDITNMILTSQKNPTLASVLNWSFVDGDRMRLIRKMSDNTVYDETYDAALVGIVNSPTIQGIPQPDKTFVKIRKVAPFAALDYSSNFFVIQLYRPAQAIPSAEDVVFNEFAQQFPIIDPTTAERVHGGQVTNQDILTNTAAEFNFYEGGSYFRLRTVNITATTSNIFYVQDRNFVDFYISGVNSLQGRPSAIDIYQRETFFSAMVRFGQEYQPNTNINGLNLFLPENFQEYDYGYADIERMKVRDRQMRIFQKFKTGVVSIFSQINKSPDGTTINVVTDKLLNPIQYYLGDYGINSAPESLSSFNHADYFTDNNRGAIVRVSLDGVSAISVQFKVNSWAVTELPLRTGDCKIYGAFNQQLNQYIISLNAVDNSPAQTLIYSEDIKNFESFASYTPENMCTLGTLFISFKNGDLYTHDNPIYNNFYNTQYPSSITPIFNKDPMVKKVFDAIAYQSNKKWVSPTTGDIQTSMVNPQTNTIQTSQLIDQDYERQENVLYAAFLRDYNSLGGLLNGDFLNGVYIKTKLVCPAASTTGIVSFQFPYINYQISPRNF